MGLQKTPKNYLIHDKTVAIRSWKQSEEKAVYSLFVTMGYTVPGSIRWKCADYKVRNSMAIKIHTAVSWQCVV